MFGRESATRVCSDMTRFCSCTITRHFTFLSCVDALCRRVSICFMILVVCAVHTENVDKRNILSLEINGDGLRRAEGRGGSSIFLLCVLLFVAWHEESEAIDGTIPMPCNMLSEKSSAILSLRGDDANLKEPLMEQHSFSTDR